MDWPRARNPARLGSFWSDGVPQNALMELLRAHEWRDVEFKEAQRELGH